MANMELSATGVAAAEPRSDTPLAHALDTLDPQRGIWIRSARYDWIFLIGGVLFIAAIIAMFYAVDPFSTNVLHLGSYAQWINILVPLLLGGPHILMSFSRNYMDSEFRMRHPALLKTAPHGLFLCILALTVMPRAIGIPVLMNLVFFSAVFHGLSQLAHLTIKYDRNHRREARRMREMVLNAVLIFTGPCAYVFWAIGTTDMRFVGVRVAPVLSHPFLVGILASTFVVAACIYLAQCVRDLAAGRFNAQRFMTIVITQIAFVVLVEVGNADVTFQAYNAWHSFQAMGLYWAACNARWHAGKQYGPAVAWSKDGTFLKAYIWGVGFALALGVLVVGLSYATMTGTMADLAISPWYFLLPITALLFHHFMDYFTFFRKGAFDY